MDRRPKGYLPHPALWRLVGQDHDKPGDERGFARQGCGLGPRRSSQATAESFDSSVWSERIKSVDATFCLGSQ